MLGEFVRDRCAEYVHGVPGAAFLTDLLTGFVTGGKFVRSTFAYLGWLSAATDGDPEAPAAAETQVERFRGSAVKHPEPYNGATCSRPHTA